MCNHICAVLVPSHSLLQLVVPTSHECLLPQRRFVEVDFGVVSTDTGVRPTPWPQPCPPHSHLHITHRYIWSKRLPLDRNFHDMSKQEFDNKVQTPQSWKPLHDYIYNGGESNITTLLSFNKKDKKFHLVVARCLWLLASASNVPFGRAAAQPQLYSKLPPFEKVLCM